MGSYWLSVILFRIVLPSSIIIASCVRPTITSYIYLIMGLWLPFFSVPTADNTARNASTYLKIFVITCIFICTCVISFYFALFFPQGKEYDSTIRPCDRLERILRTVGFIEFRELPLVDTINWAFPEALMLITSVSLRAVLLKLAEPKKINEEDYADEIETNDVLGEIIRRKILAMLLSLGKYVVIGLFCLTGILRPSIIGALYYLVFLVFLTCWASNMSFGRTYAKILLILLPVIATHLSMLCLYQLQYFQDNDEFSPQSFYGRLFRLVRLRTYRDCADPRRFKLHPFNAGHGLPYLLFLLYNLCVLVSREILKANDGILATLVAFFKSEKNVDDEYLQFGMTDRVAYEKSLKEKVIAMDENLLVDKIRHKIGQAAEFVTGVSYLVANFVMMIWAIMYISWKTLVLLIWANLLWLLPGRRKIMLVTSPLVVIWVWFLLCICYVYSLDFDIPHQFGMINLVPDDFQSKDNWMDLLVRSFFSVIIFSSLRQFLRERAVKKEDKIWTERRESDTIFTPKSKTWRKVKQIIIKWFALCWIWVVIITMIWMVFTSMNNPFRISYVALAILLILTFQLCPFSCWKKCVMFYWWIVIIYAMLNLFLVYLHQIRLGQHFLHTYVYSEEGFKYLGFHHTPDPRDRLMDLANPLAFQIAIVIQYHYLQELFDKLTTPKTPEEIAAGEEELKEIHPFFQILIGALTNAKNVFFALMEIHLRKIMLLIGWMLCSFDCCALFVPFVVLLTASCTIGRRFTLFTIRLMSVYVQILILARLVYMNKHRDHSTWNYVGYYNRNGKQFNVTLNTADWLGFHESRYGQHFADFWQFVWSFGFVFTVTLHRIVHIRQRNYRISRNISTVRQRVLFPLIDYHNCHDSIKNMLKFLVNYGFFKLGIEITLIVAAIVMMIRMDIVAIIIALCLVVTFKLNRKWIENILLPLMISIAAWLPFQYVMSLGYWPTNWKNSGTEFWNKNDLRVRIQQFCHLMNMAHPPPNKKVIYDFILMMCLSRQLRVFNVTRKFKGKDFAAGSNENVAHLIDEINIDNPVPDFVTYTRNLLDVYKKVIFYSWFYLSLLACFLAGTMNPAIYSFGYILAAFLLMWEGTDVFLRSPEKILARWNSLLLYNVSIMVFRTVNQLFGCIFIYELQSLDCRIYSIFDAGCVDRFALTANIPRMNRYNLCNVQPDALSMEWDCVCFFFLIIQQRIFKSFHFFHIVNNAKAQKILAYRGAQLIEEQRKKKKQEVDNREAFIHSNIEKRVEYYRAKRQKVHGDALLKKKRNHKQRIRSGDYYLFDDAEYNMVPLLPPEKEDIDAEYEPFDPMKFSEYIDLCLETNIPNVLYERKLRQLQKVATKQGMKGEDLNKAVVLKISADANSTAQDPISVSIYLTTTAIGQIFNILLFSWGLFESIIASITSLCNRASKDFRSVSNEIKRDKKILKENTKYTRGIREGPHNVWKPSRSYSNFFKSKIGEKVEEIKIYYTFFGKLLRSIWYLVLSQSEWICYLVIVTYQVIRGKFISLPLPIMVFCWGAMTLPRPTKTFWVITIAYFVVMSLMKSFFAMSIVDWNQNSFPENQFFPPSIIGVDRYFNPWYNVTLLFVLIFHRVVLQWQGLWEPSIYRKITLIKNGDYILKDGKFVHKTEGDGEKTLRIRTTTVVEGNFFLHGARKYAEGFRLFIQQLISPTSTQIPVDVYTPMFVCEIITFFLVLFYYGYFKDTESDAMGVIGYIQNNRVPGTYILIISCYFLVIIIDRWVYKRRNRFAKLILHLFQVLLVHLWAFVLYPMLTGRIFIETLVVQVFYMLKCCYFLFSAYQIRNGYPRVISGHCLQHGTSMYHRMGFKLYGMVPYLSEMRSLLDWICTDTALGVGDWFKLERITAHFFVQKCQQDREALEKNTEIKPLDNVAKYFTGGFLFVLLFLTIIFPFVVFSLRKSVGVRTHPIRMNIEVYMGSTDPIFYSFASGNNFIPLTKKDYRNLTNTFYNIRGAETLFGNFDYKDVVAVKWSSHSHSSWSISSGNLDELIEDIKSPIPFGFQILIRYTHIGSGGEKNERVFGESTYMPPLPGKVRQDLLNMLANGTDDVIWLPLVFPKFLKITSEGKPYILPLMERPKGQYHGRFDRNMEAENAIDESDDVRNPERLRNLLVIIRKEHGHIWWQVHEECNSDDANYNNYLKDLVHNSCEYLIMYTFNEKVFTGAFHKLTGGGIIGLYLIYFMVAFGIIRSKLVDITDIWIAELPNSDRIYTICQEVYIARDMKNFELEELLFSELIFILRSQELCIKLTRYKDDPYNPSVTAAGSR